MEEKCSSMEVEEPWVVVEICSSKAVVEMEKAAVETCSSMELVV
ncbi:hypothetical protein GCM10023197_25990 [Gordonia humi]